MSPMWPYGTSTSTKSTPRIYRKLFVTGNINFNDGSACKVEELLDFATFKKIVFNFDEDPRPVVFLSALVEYGCESLLPHFYLTSFEKKYKDYRRIVIGWPGRKFLYYPFVHEYWEIDSSLCFLRHYTKAFTGMSKNIKIIENGLSKFGKVIKSHDLNIFFCQGICNNCKKTFVSTTKVPVCSSCRSESLTQSILGDTSYHKKRYKAIDFDFSGYENWLNKVIKGKTIGIFARNRKTYGRNLPKEFYQLFCDGLIKKGYNIVWLGEKESTLPCIDDTFYDFTTGDKADDIFACHALVSKCVATFQAWTASTRLAQATNTPYCLVESYDQIFGLGQEGKRINLLTQDLENKKIIFGNYRLALQNIDFFAKQCLDYFIDFIENKNSKDVFIKSEHCGVLESYLKVKDLWKTI